jgi:membrane-anchored protein YejM (alkaline phosphatase superfamily)
VCYADYVAEENEKDLYSDQLLFDNAAIRESFFREGQTLNFIITRSAHLSYKYNEVLSYWALKQYPEYRGMTGHEETDCMYLKAKLVGDMFARLLQELEAEGQLENTVIVAVTDHYAYGYKDVEEMMALSGVEHALLLEKTPCFIWSADKPSIEVTKTLNTSDLLPTVLNLLGVESPYHYIGQDAFDPRYSCYALFTDGSWIANGAAYSAATDEVLLLEAGREVTAEEMEEMTMRLNSFVYINNLILETNYFHR